jgi:hypothetical protein
MNEGPFKTTGTAKDPTLQPDLDTHVSIIAAALARMPKLRGLILKNHELDDPNYTYSHEDIALCGPRTEG